MKPLSDCLLYTFVDTGYLHGRRPEDVARMLCDGGADLVQLRAKRATAAEVRDLAGAILPVTRACGVRLVINDHPKLALELGAEFCHLGQEDFFAAGHTHIAELRQLLAKEAEERDPGELRFGLSTHAPGQCRRAIAAGADYVAIGPVHATPTKPAARPVTLEYVRWAAANVAIPWFGIGGVNEETLEAILEAGARRVCVVSAILNDPDPARACARFKKRLVSASS